MDKSNMIGKVIDNKYELEKLVGQGGMARVYCAKDIRLGRKVAVKILKSEYGDNEQFVKKFLREAQADAKLAHPNIVNVYDVGEEEGMYYIVMEYVDGPTLNDYIKKNKHLSPEESVNIIYSVAQGLNHAHSHGIIHRDIKPHNILLTQNKVPKVADFGIALATTSSTLTAATEETLGSVHYVSPEQARGGFLDERSDLYSLGIMMFQMITGQLPYDGDTPVSVALMHVQNDMQDPRIYDKNIPKGVAQVVLNLTKRKPEERYQNVKELMTDLRKLKEDIHAEILPTYVVTGRPDINKKIKKKKNKKTKTTKDKKKLIYIATGITVAVLLIVFLIFFLQPKHVACPSLDGKSEIEVIETLHELGLEYDIKYSPDPNIPSGYVISQEPLADSDMIKGDTVKIVISTGPKMVEVPSVLNQSEVVATATMNDANLVVYEVIYEFNDDYAKNIVYAQSPAAGEKVAEGSNVTLYVSKGKDVVTVPSLTGMTLDEARAALEEAGLQVGEVKYSSSSSSSIGVNQVMNQSPSAYASVPRDSYVNIVLNQGTLRSANIVIDLSEYVDNVSDPTVAHTVQVITTYYDANNSKIESTVYSNDVMLDHDITVTIKGYNIVIWYLYIDNTRVDSGTVQL